MGYTMGGILTEVVTGRKEVAGTVGRPYQPTVKCSALLLSRCPALPLSLHSDSFTPFILFTQAPLDPSPLQPVNPSPFTPSSL